MRLLLFINSYRNNFLNDSSGSGWGWDDGTIYFYFFIIFFVFVLSYSIEKNKSRQKTNVKPLFYLLGMVLSLVLGLRGQYVGKDTLTYIESFYESRTYIWDSSGLEPGFMFVNKLLMFLFSDGRATIIFFSFFTVYFVMSSIWRYKSIIAVFWSLGYYVGIYFFPSLNLLRLYFAASVITWGFHYLISGNERKYIITVFAASLFHLSSLVMLLPLFYYKLYKKNKWLPFVLLCLAAFFVTIIANRFSDYLTIQRYAAYGETNEFEGGVGIMLFVDYLPGLFLIWYIWKYKLSGIWPDMCVSFTLVAIFIRSIGYYIIIAGRMGAHFMVLYLIIVPYFLIEMKKNHRKEYIPFTLFMFVFLLFKIDLYFKGYLASDGIMPYYFLWND